MENNIIKIINEWNPIEIYPLLNDEYSVEIEIIMDFIGKRVNISEYELAKFLEKTFKTAFGEDLFFSDKQKCIEVAKKILKERETNRNNE